MGTLHSHTMALPPLVKQLAEHLLIPFCARRSPADLREKVRVSSDIRGNTLTIHEHRVLWDDPRSWSVQKVAVLKYDTAAGTWELFCFDRNSRQRPYCAKPTADLAALLVEIDTDPTGIFWG